MALKKAVLGVVREKGWRLMPGLFVELHGHAGSLPCTAHVAAFLTYGRNLNNGTFAALDIIDPLIDKRFQNAIEIEETPCRHVAANDIEL